MAAPADRDLECWVRRRIARSVGGPGSRNQGHARSCVGPHQRRRAPAPRHARLVVRNVPCRLRLPLSTWQSARASRSTRPHGPRCTRTPSIPYVVRLANDLRRSGTLQTVGGLHSCTRRPTTGPATRPSTTLRHPSRSGQVPSSRVSAKSGVTQGLVRSSSGNPDFYAVLPRRLRVPPRSVTQPESLSTLWGLARRRTWDISALLFRRASVRRYGA